MFRKVLIANRGAIAVRIERTLRRMGIPSVALYTTADQNSRHVELADEAVWIGEGPAQDSYLDGERILDIAASYGVDAIHPGYGFLSENAAFARRCHARHITFIGPTPEQIELFGQKHRAREIATAVGVPVVPGSSLMNSLEEALLAAEAIGYPVMLKATAGGGGIGMQICNDETALRQAFDSVGRVAQTHFRDAGVFLEKYIARGRHIEVQIFGTATGEVVTLGERDCSIQRRNQKILEESPAPYLTPEIRAKMASAAQRLAEAVHYRNAGTVEFILDTDTGEFYLLEVNTRLQVEHGVTEEVLGIDLVEWMILEAANNLDHLRERVPNPVGHSIEVRLY
ncbi:MAG: ATP-grasp domain-containing protein, partial [Sulfobacillus sp.]|nr:ATP-grasp domain-containing protein [Sulfobacillus sp.]